MHTDITPHTLPLILLINLLKYLFIVHCIAPPPLGLSESVLFDEAGRSRTSLNSSSIELLSTRLCNVSPSFLHPLRTGKTLVTIPVGGCSISRGAINISISRYSIAFCETKNTNQKVNLLILWWFGANLLSQSNSFFSVQVYLSLCYSNQDLHGHRSYYLTPNIKFY